MFRASAKTLCLIAAAFHMAGCSTRVVPAPVLIGSWQVDEASTFGWYVEQGIPWHMDTQLIRSGKFAGYRLDIDAGRYVIKTKAAGKMAGRYEVIYSDGKDFVLQMFPGGEDGSGLLLPGIAHTNFDELIKVGMERVSLPGSRVPNWMGLRFIDEDTVMPFSLVLVRDRSIGKKMDGMVLRRVHAPSGSPGFSGVRPSRAVKSP